VAVFALSVAREPAVRPLQDHFNDILEFVARVADRAPELSIPHEPCELCHTLDGHHGAARRENLPEHVTSLHYDEHYDIWGHRNPMHTYCIVAKANSIVRRPGDITREMLRDVYSTPQRGCDRCNTPTANVSCSAEGCWAGICYVCFNNEGWGLSGLSRGLNYFCEDHKGPGGEADALDPPPIVPTTPWPLDTDGRPHRIRVPPPTEYQVRHH